MTASPTWSIVHMDVHADSEGRVNVVSTAHWTIKGTDGDYEQSSYGSQGLLPVGDAPFTAFDALTESQVLGWVHNAMGAERVADLEASVAKLAPPAPALSLPWAV